MQSLEKKDFNFTPLAHSFYCELAINIKDGNTKREEPLELFEVIYDYTS
jgi:hypothetical protein